ncbi:hypothetical protein ACIBI3_28695 [Actinomadura luteofluorescens]|uniref:hypothetical protein n=1 Tax=Actinomadura luteofluorescens TaxID=46163 RepID=UPI00347B1A26
MSGPYDGDGSRNSERRDEPQEWPERILQGLLIDFCCTLIISGGLRVFDAFSWWNALATMATVMLATVLLFVAFPGTMHGVLEWTWKALRLTATATATAWTLAGAATMTLVLLAGYGAYNLWDGARPCGQPLELRMLTAQDALTALRGAAQDFESDTGKRGCRKYSVTVIPEPGPVALSDGFARLWRSSESSENERLFGPQPDIWIPSSTAEYEYVSHAAVSEGGRLTQSCPPTAKQPDDETHRLELCGSLGTSPLVLALFPKANAPVADSRTDPVKSSTKDLLKTISDAGVRLRNIARPVPETSGAALAVTPVLYGPKSAGDAEAAEAERFAEPADLVTPDAVSLLCRFRRQMTASGGGPPDDVAMIAPEQVLYDYDMGLALGDDDRCPRVDRVDQVPEYKKWRLYPHYASDLPLLDHPFVKVRWQGQDSAERNSAVNEFRRWLKDNPLTMRGFRDRSGRSPSAPAEDREHAYLPRLRTFLEDSELPEKVPSPGRTGFQEILDRIKNARPKSSIHLMVDASTSMGSASGGNGGSRLGRGAAVLQSLVSQLQSTDRVDLQFSATSPSIKLGYFRVEQDAASANKETIMRNLQAMSATGRDTALDDIVEATDLDRGKQEIVLLTDGQGPKSTPGLDSRTARLSDFFRRHGQDGPLRLTVVLTGPATCEDTPVREIVASLGPHRAGACVELDDTPEETQAARILSDLRWSRRA